MIDDKINRYRHEISLAKSLSSMKHADRDYYENLIIRFERILRFYEDLKALRKVDDR